MTDCAVGDKVRLTWEADPRFTAEPERTFEGTVESVDDKHIVVKGSGGNSQGVLHFPSFAMPVEVEVLESGGE